MRNNKDLVLNQTLKYFPFIIVVIAIVIYYPSLFGEFIIDDTSYFTNDLFTKLTPLDFRSIFFHPSNYWGELLPIRDYLYVLEFNLFKNKTFGYHVVSLIIYIASAFVVFSLVKELLFNFNSEKKIAKLSQSQIDILACVLMSFFLLTPMYVENVAYISGQKDILSVFFILLTIYFLYKAGTSTTTTSSFLLLGILFHYMAVLSKLSALSSILFIPILWLITSNKKSKEIFQLNFVWGILNIPVILWFFYVTKVTEPFQNVFKGTDLANRIPRALNIIGIHIEHLVWPQNLSFGYIVSPAWSINFSFVIGLLFLIGALILFIIKKRSLEVVGLFIFGVYLLPVLQIYPEIDNHLVYDRYLALPIVGIFILIIGIYSSLIHRRLFFKIAIILSVIICFGWGYTTYNYIPKFKSQQAYSEHFYKLNPDSFDAEFRLARILLATNQFEFIEKNLATKDRGDEGNWINDYYLGSINLRRGEIEKAYILLSSSSIQGNHPLVNIELAKAMIMKKDYRSARRILSRVQPSNEIERVEKLKVEKLFR